MDAPDGNAGFKRVKHGPCPLCARKGALTFHHLIPRELHRRVYFKKTDTREERQRGIAICRLCHDGIHAIYDGMTLAKAFDTPERIMADARRQKHFRWAAKQKG